MKHLKSAYFYLTLVSVLIGASLEAADDLLDAVDPFIGVDRYGNVLPGTCLPFSLVRLGPDMVPPQRTSGYTTGQPVMGFSHTHTSGTGGAGRYGNVLVTPVVGEVAIADRSSPISGEQAQVGYYRATLDRWQVTAELTQTERCGVHRYTFAKGGGARLLIEAGAYRRGKLAPEGVTPGAVTVRLVSDRVVEGTGFFRGGWGNAAGHPVCFVAESDRPFTGRLWRHGALLPADITNLGEGADGGAELSFALGDGETVELRVGVSFSSIENARIHLAQTRGKDFGAVRTAAREAWRNRLNCIQVDGGTPEQRTKFYTALYRTMVMPTDVTGDAPGWPTGTPHFWDFYCLWDTHHTVNPLYALVQSEQAGRLVACLTDIAQRKGWVPDAWIAGDYAAIQGGTNGDVVIADAIIKNVPGFDREAAYRAIRRDGMEDSGQKGPIPTRGRSLDSYLKHGYLPSTSIDQRETPTTPVSRTLEYAYNDACLAKAAKALGHTEDAARFQRQSLSCWNLFHPEEKLFRARNSSGDWMAGPAPDKALTSWVGPYYEGTPWQYAFSAAHDVQGLINRHGGRDNFVAILDRFFDGKYYTQGNEPDIIVPWLYAYAGRPDRIVTRVGAIMSREYGTGRGGLPGNDDAGTMSAWYVFAAMGFYPNAGQDVYLLGSPTFRRIVMTLAEGRRFTIVAEDLSPENRYVQSATLGGEPWNRCWFRHGDIAGGGELRLKMGPRPGNWGTGEAPPSLSAAP